MCGDTSSTSCISAATEGNVADLVRTLGPSRNAPVRIDPVHAPTASGE